MDDKQALERYRYLLRTAPPGDIERAHQEAFAQLTPEQRAEVLRQLAEHVPASEVGGDDPKSLARTATRAEMRQPGTIERALGAGAPGLGSMFLSTLAGAFVGSAIANAVFDDDGGSDGDDSGDAGDTSDSSDSGESAFDDSGGDFGDAGGDFGGDFGGGDFGGGDFGG